MTFLKLVFNKNVLFVYSCYALLVLHKQYLFYSFKEQFYLFAQNPSPIYTKLPSVSPMSWFFVPRRKPTRAVGVAEEGVRVGSPVRLFPGPTLSLNSCKSGAQLADQNRTRAHLGITLEKQRKHSLQQSSPLYFTEQRYPHSTRLTNSTWHTNFVGSLEIQVL